MINNEERFNIAPTVKAPRSTFLMEQNIRTTFNAGLLIPFYVDSDIMPGDTFEFSGAFVCRQTTSIHPTMDNAYIDIVFTFTPHRLVWDHWKEFWGENTTGAWTQQTVYTIPQIKFARTGGSPSIEKGMALQYMGLPMNIPSSANGMEVSAIPLRVYQLNWNELWRDENMAAPYHVYTGDNTQEITQQNNTTYAYGKYTANTQYVQPTCAPVYKFKDYLNACLPEPQKGTPISLPIGSTAPVIGNGTALGFTDGTNNAGIINSGTDQNNSEIFSTGAFGTNTGTGSLGAGSSLATYTSLGITDDKTKSGLIADLSNAVAATINAQRVAFAAQRILEASARTGTRYWEVLEGIFGVSNPNAARLQRPEVLCHRRIPVNMTQVAQTSSTDTTSAQGNLTAFSHTVDANHYFTKSFTEHGTLMGFLCVRTKHSYDQGIARMWSRKEKLDFYHPQLAFLGEQAILNKEIMATNTATDNQVFGYNERWAELRSKMNINSAAFSTQYAQTLASWHYGDSYSTLPVLSDDWRRETPDFIDRTLAVSHTLEDQFLFDSHWKMKATRCLPMFSIPSLIDHY